MQKVSNSKQKKKKKADWEMIPYVDYLDDARKQKAANILAYSGWNKERRTHGAITAAARAVGVNRMTIYAWLEDEKMVMAVEEAKAELCAMAMNGLRELVKEKNFGACAFLLERLQPEQFSHQYLRLEHEKEMRQLEEDLRAKIVESAQLPNIIIQPLKTPEYERNKIDDE